jgi:2-hydroxy-3-keto-5-methylthiopentenyl-1-phosphate phosphatase
MSGESYGSILSSKNVCYEKITHVKVLALDFDKTCTTKAILDIYKAREDYHINNKDILDQEWEKILQFYSSIMEPILKPLNDPKPMATRFDGDGLRRFLTDVGNGDYQAIDKLISSKLVQGITPKGLFDFAQNVELMPGVLTVLENLQKALNLPLHVISLNFSEKLIQYVLNREKTLPIEIHTNKLDFVNGTSNGIIDKKFVTASDKEVQLQGIIENAGNGVTIYIGDSFTDILALLKADIGIIIGESKSILKVCNDFGIHVVPLSEWSYGRFNNSEESKVLFSVSHWNEIQKFIFAQFICGALK